MINYLTLNIGFAYFGEPSEPPRINLMRGEPVQTLYEVRSFNSSHESTFTLIYLQSLLNKSNHQELSSNNMGLFSTILVGRLTRVVQWKSF